MAQSMEREWIREYTGDYEMQEEGVLDILEKQIKILSNSFIEKSERLNFIWRKSVRYNL